MTKLYCGHCKYFQHIPRTPFDRCEHPEAKDYVGRSRDPFYVRQDGPCGPDVKLFEPKPEKPKGWLRRLLGL